MQLTVVPSLLHWILHLLPHQPTTKRKHTMSEIAASPEPHIAVLAFPFGTHAAPLLAVVRRLAESAPHAHFSFFSTAQSNAALFPGGAAEHGSNIEPYDVTDGLPEDYAFRGNPQEPVKFFLSAADDAFRGGMSAAAAARGRKVSCVMSDAFLWFAAETAEAMAVPWVALWTAGPIALCAHMHTDAIREKFGAAGVAGDEDETIEFVPGLSNIRVRDLIQGIVSGDLNSIFSVMPHKMALRLPQAAAVFINSFEELDPVIITANLKSNLKVFLSIGPLNLHETVFGTPRTSDPSGCISWLDKQKPASVAYISFGSVVVPPPSELAAVAEALEACGAPFIWSLKDNAKAHLPEAFLDKAQTQGIIVSWAPQKEVLAHSAVGVFVTHGGWNSVLESMAGSVPMICRPVLGDQPLNTRTIEVIWQVGVEVEGRVISKDGLLRCLDLVLSSEEGKTMRTRFGELKELGAKAVSPKGSSTENFRRLLEAVLRT